MNEFLSTLLQAVIIAAVPVCATFIGKGILAFVQYINERTESDTAKKYLDAAADAVSTAVTYTNQVYVDTLKKSDQFSKENQTEALNMAVDKAVSLLTEEAVKFLEEAYGDLTSYLAAKIEAEVRNQKQQNDIITLGEPFTAELKESPDVASVAATTAAATAAAVVQSALPQTAPAQGADAPQEGGAAQVV